MRRRLAVLAVALAATGCKDRRAHQAPPPAPVAALGAIPVDATAVVGLDVARLARSRLVARAVEQMLDRDPELRTRLTELSRACELDLTTQVEQVHLALGPVRTGTRTSLLVATGGLAEATLTRCLQAGVGSGGGEVTVRQSGGRTLYRLVAGRRELFFGFGQARTVVLGPSEDWVVAGLGDGPKVEASPALGPALAKVDRAAAAWAVATIDPELGLALTRLTSGKVTAGPRLVSGSLDPLDGVRASAAFTMVSPADARALADYARGELTLGSLAAQALGLGPVLAKVQVATDGPQVRFSVALTDTEIKDVLAAIDRGRPPGQDAQPAAAGLPSPPVPAPSSTPTPDGGVDAR